MKILRWEGKLVGKYKETQGVGIGFPGYFLSDTGRWTEPFVNNIKKHF